MNCKSVFEVVSGDQRNGKLQDVKHAGVSSLREDNGFYKLTLNMWPGVDYFISKNQSNNNYTIFSKIVRNGTDTKFQNPVGYAKILKDLRTHLLLRFRKGRFKVLIVAGIDRIGRNTRHLLNLIRCVGRATPFVGSKRLWER